MSENIKNYFRIFHAQIIEIQFKIDNFYQIIIYKTFLFKINYLTLKISRWSSEPTLKNGANTEKPYE